MNVLSENVTFAVARVEAVQPTNDVNKIADSFFVVIIAPQRNIFEIQRLYKLKIMYRFG